MGKTICKLTEENKQQLVEYTKQGLMDSEIAIILGVTRSAILYWRRKLNIKSEFTYSKISKIKKENFEPLFKQGLSDYKIAKLLNVSPCGVFDFRKRNGYSKEDLRLNKAIELTQFQKEVLIGTVLGDSSLRRINHENTCLICSHSLVQKQYCEEKTAIFKSLGAKVTYHKRQTPDKRTGKFYESYVMNTPKNPALNSWYESFYKNGKKVIPFNLFDYFTEVSLAFMFMDDGFRLGSGLSIATNCFTEEEVNKFRLFLLEKFDLKTSYHKSSGTTYIHKKSVQHFVELVSPYIYECVKYKISHVTP